jgi:DNA-binding response OmpR family regulator
MGTWLQRMATALGLTACDESESGEAATQSGIKVAVLAIDDDPEFLGAIRPLLTAHGFEVYITTSGAKGLNILANAPENLRVLLLDYKMPKFDGADTLRYVHQVRRNIKVIAVTGIGYDQLPSEFRSGVDKIIFKPFKAEDLVAAINAILVPPTQLAVNASQ